MKACKTKHRFETGLKQPKISLTKNGLQAVYKYSILFTYLYTAPLAVKN